MKGSLMTKQRGLSLIELMIAVTLGIFITAAVIQLFTNSKQSYRVQENLSRLQENGRFAMHFLSHDIRMAGNMGCIASTRILTNTLNDTSSFNYNFDAALFGSDATGASSWAPALDASILSPLSGNDVITIRGILDAGIDITGQPNVSSDCSPPSAITNSANIKVTNNDLLEADDIVLAGNCENAAVFQITQFNAGEVVVHNTGGGVPGNATKDLGACFAGNGQLFKLTSRTYYIRNNPANTPALYRKDGSAPAEELVEGIEGMQILYGEDNDNDKTPDYYMPAGSAGLNMDNVVSVKISLLVTTLEDNLSTQAVPYTIFGALSTPIDRKIRRVFTSTIAIRNRLP